MTVARIAAVLAREGEAATLRRRTSAPGAPDAFAAVAVRAVVQDYRPTEILGNVKQGDRKIILSDADIARAGWPGPPRPNDWVDIRGRTVVVQGCDTRLLRGAAAMHILQVRG